jgi:class 3 adenylate cyclase
MRSKPLSQVVRASLSKGPYTPFVQRRVGAARGRLGAVLFTDIVGSTTIAAELGNRRWATFISRHHQLVRRELRRFGGREHDSAGDGFFATFDRPVDGIRCAVAIAQAVRSLGIEIRAGVTFGELEVESGKPSGLVVNTAARVMSVAGAGEVLVPASVRDIVSGAGISFDDHGTHRLKGLDDEVRLFRVTEVDGEPVGAPLEPQEAAERRHQILPGPGRGRARVVVAAIVTTAVVAATIVLLQNDGTEKGPREAAGSRTFLVELDAADATERQRIDIVRPSRSAQHPDASRAMVADRAAVWVVAPGFETATLLHVDPEHGEVRDPIAIEQPAITVSMISAFDALWYLTPDRLVRVSASTDDQDMVQRVAAPTDLGADRRGVSLAADRDHLWIGRIDGRLVRLDPSGGFEERRVADALDLVAATDDGVWVVAQFDGVVIGVDPATLRPVWEQQVLGTITRFAVDDDYLWLLDQSSGVLTRLSSSTGTGADQAPVGRGVTDLSVGLGAAWLSHADGTISRVDRLTLEVTEFAQVEGGASAIAADVDRHSVWVDVGPPVVNEA